MIYIVLSSILTIDITNPIECKRQIQIWSNMFLSQGVSKTVGQWIKNSLFIPGSKGLNLWERNNNESIEQIKDVESCFITLEQGTRSTEHREVALCPDLQLLLHSFKVDSVVACAVSLARALACVMWRNTRKCFAPPPSLLSQSQHWYDFFSKHYSLPPLDYLCIGSV